MRSSAAMFPVAVLLVTLMLVRTPAVDAAVGAATFPALYKLIKGQAADVAVTDYAADGNTYSFVWKLNDKKLVAGEPGDETEVKLPANIVEASIITDTLKFTDVTDDTNSIKLTVTVTQEGGTDPDSRDFSTTVVVLTSAHTATVTVLNSQGLSANSQGDFKLLHDSSADRRRLDFQCGVQGTGPFAYSWTLSKAATGDVFEAVTTAALPGVQEASLTASTLVVEDLTFLNDDWRISCQASNTLTPTTGDAVTVSSSARSEPLPLATPAHVVSRSPTATTVERVIPGDVANAVTLECVVGGFPTVTAVWYGKVGDSAEQAVPTDGGDLSGSTTTSTVVVTDVSTTEIGPRSRSQLTLQGMTVEAARAFRCEATDAAGDTATTPSWSLAVLRTPTVTNGKAAVSVDAAGGNKADTFALECTASGWVAGDEPTWTFTNGAKTVTGAVAVTDNVSKGTADVPAVLRNRGAWSCSATSRAGKVTADATTEVTVNDLPAVQNMSPTGELTAFVNENPSRWALQCRFTGAPAVTVRVLHQQAGADTWSTVREAVGTEDTNDGLPRYTLEFEIAAEEGLQPERRGTYKCAGQNALGLANGDEWVEAPDTLVVKAFEKWEWTVHPNDGGDLTWSTGNTYALECEGSGYPAPNAETSYRWLFQKDGAATSQLLSNGPRFNGIDRKTLNVVGVTEEEAGRYKCRGQLYDGDDPVGTASYSRPVAVTVLVGARFGDGNANTGLPSADDLKVPIGTEATFSCEASGEPTPTVAVQRSADSADWTTVKTGAAAAGTVSYSVADVTRDDEDMYYRCFATQAKLDGHPDPPEVPSQVFQLDVQFAVELAATFVTDPLVIVQKATNPRTADPAEIRCSVAGDPAPAFVWHVARKQVDPFVPSDFDGAKVHEDDNYSIVTTETATPDVWESVLTITNAEARHVLAYQCRATNEVGSTTYTVGNTDLTTVREVSLFAVPLVTSQPPPKTEVGEGRAEAFACAGEGVPGIAWHWESKPVGAPDVQWALLAGSPAAANLDFAAATVEQGQLDYRCCATNSIGGQERTTCGAAAQLDVLTQVTITRFRVEHGKPGTKARPCASPCKVPIGHTVTITVETEGNPAPDNISWRKCEPPAEGGGECVDEGSSIWDPISLAKITEATAPNSDKLVIPNVDFEDTGSYRAWVYQTKLNHRAAHNGYAFIEVVEAPVIFAPPSPGTDSQVMSPTMSFSFVCEAQGRPLPEIEWTLNGTPLASDADGHRAVRDGPVQTDDDGVPYKAKSELTVQKMLYPAVDGGQYACVAKNVHGEDRAEVRITIWCEKGVKPVGRCEQPCDEGTFGRNCKSDCTCAYEDFKKNFGATLVEPTTCDKVTGKCTCALIRALGQTKVAEAYEGGDCAAGTAYRNVTLASIKNPPETGGGGSSAGVVAGVVVVVIVLAAVAAALFVYQRRKGGEGGLRQSFVGLRKGGAADESHVEMTDVQTMESTLLNVNDLAQRVALYSRNDCRLFTQEFQALDDGGEAFNATTEAANHPVNKPKNRYTNIVPYDHSRVLLGRRSTLDEDEECADFINANYIGGPGQERRFIACQGPLPNTFDDMWQMIWEHGSTTIVMVTGEVEGTRIKCHRYWPEADSLDFGDVDVHFEGEEVHPDYTIRRFRLHHVVEKRDRRVTQYQYTAWPDHGVPETADKFLAFHRVVNEGRDASEDPNAPTVIHCSAGVGRTGTFIAVDNCLTRARQQNTIDVAEAVTTMRANRVNMIQTDQQYAFVYSALLLSLSLSFSSSSFPLKAGEPFDASAHEEALEDEFLALHQFTQRAVQDHTTARAPVNRKKNRYQNVLALEHSRVVLRDGKNTDYINANFIDGYGDAKNAYIATQGPLASTVADFWQMVWEQNSRAIVMATKLKEAGRVKCEKYWPEPGNTKVYGNIEVFNSSQTSHTDYIERDFTVREVSGSEKRSVAHLHFTAWPEHNVPSSPAPSLKLLDALWSKREAWRAENPSADDGPVVVHCSAGVGRTGTFILADIAKHQFADGKTVDVLRIVSQMRENRSGMVQTQAQYVFCFSILSALP